MADLRDEVDKLAAFVDELRAERGLPPRGEETDAERLHRYAHGLAAKHLPSERPTLTLIRGDHDDG